MRKKVKCLRLKVIEGKDTPLINGRDAKILLAFKSPYQLIEIVEWDPKSGKKALLLNGEVQYIEGKPSEDYHNAHASLLNACPENTKRIAIIGGGDGILAGKLAKKYPHSEIYVFELDPCMVYVFSKYERKVNHDAFNQPNVKVVIGDAFKTIRKFPKGFFDAMFIDLPDGFPDKWDLYDPEKLSILIDRLKVGGCTSIYTGGIPSKDFIHDNLPRCLKVIRTNRIVGMFGGYGEVIHAKKVSSRCHTR